MLFLFTVCRRPSMVWKCVCKVAKWLAGQEGHGRGKNQRQWGSAMPPKLLQNGSQIVPEGHLGGQEICPGGLLPPRSLLERSWTHPGPKKTSLNRLLAGPRAPRRLVSAIFAPKWVPKRRPKGYPKTPCWSKSNPNGSQGTLREP